MKVGIAPLTVGVMVMAARLAGSEAVAEALACVYLVVATGIIARGLAAAAPARD
jgi:hypothetical protein